MFVPCYSRNNKKDGGFRFRVRVLCISSLKLYSILVIRLETGSQKLIFYINFLARER